MTDETAALEEIAASAPTALPEPPELDSELADAPAADPVLDAVDAMTDVPASDPMPDAEPAPTEPEPAPPSGPITVGRMVADALRRAGVRWAFTVPGESFLGLLEGLAGAGINVVATRHEGAAAFMAEAHAQLTGRPAAALGTRAVGASNLAIGIHTARADSSPMFVLVGQVDATARGREGFQEVDLAGTIGGLAKWAAEPHTVDEAVELAGEAVAQAMTGRPGPVLLAFPEDLLDELAPAGVVSAPARPAPAKPTEEEIRAVLHLLLAGRRPVILAGAGVLRARTSNDLVRFAELTRVPVIASWRRGDVISNDHPLYLGMAGYGSPPTVRARLAEADAVLVIGSRLNEITSFGWTVPSPGARWAHVDLVPDRPHRDLAPADVRVATDARLFLRAAVSFLESRAVLDTGATDERVAANAEDRAAWEASTVIDSHPWSGPGIHPGRVVSTLRRVLPDDAILTTDAGSFGTWAARGFRFRRPGTFLGSTSGAMGYGLPAAIAAGLVHRDRAVVALCGDGGIGMTLAEIETAVRLGLRTIVMVFDNERYGMIRTYQDRRPGAEGIGTDLGPIDFAGAARALGARGTRVEDDAAFEPALRQALVSDRPTLIHLVLDRRWEGPDSRP
jgi:acetolactate synthase-1/2/3 large subunit